MKPPSWYAIGTLMCAAWLLLTPAPGMSQPDQKSTEAPQKEQALVREGRFAIRLASALKLLTTDDETEAMRELSWFKVEPRGGWIADHPVTPEILRELRRDVARAAEADRFFLSMDQALGQFDQVVSDFGLSFDYHQAPSADRYEADNTRPPSAQYHDPPPAYWDLYPWYPYPFAWSNWYFPGFFFMYDYHYTPHRRHHPHHRPPRTMERR